MDVIVLYNYFSMGNVDIASEEKVASLANIQIERIIADPESLQTLGSQEICAKIILEGLPFLEDPEKTKSLLLKTVIGEAILRIEQEAVNPVPVEEI